MKTIDIIWFVILGLGIYGAFANIQWLTFVLTPLLIGIFLIVTNKQQVDDANTFYTNMSKRVPFLFPSSWIGKTNYKFQRLISILLSIGFILFALVNLFNFFQ